MQLDVVRFFVKMLTDPGDLVLDPFGGSNSTGAMAEELERKWIAIEPNREYVAGSMGRFPQFAGVSPIRRRNRMFFSPSLNSRAGSAPSRRCRSSAGQLSPPHRKGATRP